MNTLGTETKTYVSLEESYALAVQFPAKSDLIKGQQVKLLATGEVEKLAATTDEPFGIVVKGGKLGYNATVMTPFKAVLTAKADGDLDLGAKVSVSSYDDVNFNDNYKASTVGDFVVAIALSDATDTEDVQVGVLRVPYKLV